MNAPNGPTTPSLSEQAASPAQPPARGMVSSCARGRRQITPWAYPHLRALAVIRYAVGIFLTAISIPLLSHGQQGWAALTLVGAALVFSIASLDIAAARIARVRT